MNKKDIREFARNKNFITGIYNYCDRWCERCSFTLRCMNFATTREYSDDPEACDIHNERFWQSLSEIYQVTREMLQESAEEMGIDLDSIDFEETSRDEAIKDRIAKNHECCRAAKKYYQMVDAFFESETASMWHVIDQAGDEVPSERPKIDTPDGPATLDELVEIIYWYHQFIYVKLMRSIHGALGNTPQMLEDFPNDSDGSAKVALIAIDRSIAAWRAMLAYFPSHRSLILSIIRHLDGLRIRVEKVFPQARNFIRPGFDDQQPG